MTFKQLSLSLKWNYKRFSQLQVLGAFYYGFIITMLPGGYLAEMYSSKNVILVSAIGATTCSFLSPIMARTGGYVGFIILKVIQGMLQVKYNVLC